MRWAKLIARMRMTGNVRMISARKSECNRITSKIYMFVWKDNIKGDLTNLLFNVSDWISLVHIKID
jgi:hypothetical protein